MGWGWRTFYSVFRAALRNYGVDKVPRLSAALAYYTVFSLAPFLIIVIGTWRAGRRRRVMQRAPAAIA